MNQKMFYVLINFKTRKQNQNDKLFCEQIDILSIYSNSFRNDFFEDLN